MICTVPVKSQVPLMYICMDSRGSFFALTIYGLEERKMKSKILQVCGPWLHDVSVVWQGKTYAFRSIRVNQVETILVNGETVRGDEGRTAVVINA